jgi:fermentation-respiration switch protein FrsA (DUF1100 family)
LTALSLLAVGWAFFRMGRWLSRFRYPTVDYVARVRVPVLVVHSRDDDIVPFSQGREVFAAANPPKDFLEIRGTHNEGFFVSGAAYVDGLERFLSNTVGLRPVLARE